MLGTLTNDQVDYILHSLVIGRIGCIQNDKMYIVPVSFAFKDGYIYTQSKEGMKINIMRQNPHVCFQADEIENMTNWRSVLIWGEFEELKSDPEQREGIKLLSDKLAPFITSETVRTNHQMGNPPHMVEKGMKTVVYRIKIQEKSGRFEKT